MMLGPILKYIRQAGAKREQDTDRDGFLSYHAESHAVAVGAGAGFVAVATDETKLLGALLPAVTSGLRAKDREFGRILADVRQEPHYALGGLVLGAAVGALTRVVL
jgi:hypothetical protein